MPTSDVPLRVNLQRIYRWSRFRQEYCQVCKGPVDYGALVEVYTPRPDKNPGSYQTEAEAFQASDDYCNALTESQEAGQFTMYAVYPVCGACAGREIIEDLSDFAAPLLELVRAEQDEHLWMAICIHYEPGAYGKYQPFFIYSYLPMPIQEVYKQATRGRLSDEPRVELSRYPLDRTHRKAKKRKGRGGSPLRTQRKREGNGD